MVGIKQRKSTMAIMIKVQCKVKKILPCSWHKYLVNCLCLSLNLHIELTSYNLIICTTWWITSNYYHFVNSNFAHGRAITMCHQLVLLWRYLCFSYMYTGFIWFHHLFLYFKPQGLWISFLHFFSPILRNNGHV